MKQVIIYARYFSNLQNDRSIEDQIVSCRGIVHSNEMVTNIYSDRAISGVHMNNRPGILALLKEIETGTVSVIIAEDLDRLSRNQGDIARIFSLAEYYGVEIRTIMNGRINDMHVGLMGTMSALELKKMAERIKRGQYGNIRAGKASSGLTYGYAVEPYNDKGVLERGWRRIVPEDAAIVRRIYTDYLSGIQLSKIARALNEEGVPAPRGGGWSSFTLSGHWGRHNGILQNPIYKGTLLWNRHNCLKHPVTGKRVIRPNSKDMWLENDVPDLQIIDTDLWDAVQQRRLVKRRKRAKAGQKYPAFDFAIFCHSCGAKMVMVSRTYIQCSDNKSYGTCEQNLKIRRDQMMVALFKYVSQITAVKRWPVWQAYIDKALQENVAKMKAIIEELEDINTKNGRLLDAITKGLEITAVVKERMTTFDQTSSRLQVTLETLIDLPSHDAVSRGVLKAVLNRAKSEDARLLLVDAVIGSIKVGRDRDGSIMFSDVWPDLHGIAKLNANE